MCVHFSCVYTYTCICVCEREYMCHRLRLCFFFYQCTPYALKQSLSMTLKLIKRPASACRSEFIAQCISFWANPKPLNLRPIISCHTINPNKRPDWRGNSEGMWGQVASLPVMAALKTEPPWHWFLFAVSLVVWAIFHLMLCGKLGLLEVL